MTLVVDASAVAAMLFDEAEGERAASLMMLSALAHVRIDRVSVPPADVAQLAAQTGLSAYDAAYLWLAISRDAELVTLDNQLARVNQTMRERFV